MKYAELLEKVQKKTNYGAPAEVDYLDYVVRATLTEVGMGIAEDGTIVQPFRATTGWEPPGGLERPPFIKRPKRRR